MLSGAGMSSVGWGGGELPVGGAGELAAALVDRPVVGPAHQGQIRQVGGAAMEPVAQVVGLASGQGRWQPGNTQPPSRTARAAGWAAWTTRRLRPTSSGWVGAPPRTGGQQGRRCLEPGGQVPLWPRPWWPGAAGAVMVGGVAGDQDPS